MAMSSERHRPVGCRGRAASLVRDVPPTSGLCHRRPVCTIKVVIPLPSTVQIAEGYAGDTMLVRRTGHESGRSPQPWSHAVYAEEP